MREKLIIIARTVVCTPWYIDALICIRNKWLIRLRMIAAIAIETSVPHLYSSVGCGLYRCTLVRRKIRRNCLNFFAHRSFFNSGNRYKSLWSRSALLRGWFKIAKSALCRTPNVTRLLWTGELSYLAPEDTFHQFSPPPFFNDFF